MSVPGGGYSRPGHQYPSAHTSISVFILFNEGAFCTLIFEASGLIKITN